MHYTAVNQQQGPGHGAQQYSCKFGIDSLLWGKLLGDWHWPFNPL